MQEVKKLDLDRKKVMFVKIMLQLLKCSIQSRKKLVAG